MLIYTATALQQVPRFSPVDGAGDAGFFLLWMVASPLPALGDVSGHPFILHHILTGLLDHWRTVEAKLLWCFLCVFSLLQSSLQVHFGGMLPCRCARILDSWSCPLADNYLMTWRSLVKRNDLRLVHPGVKHHVHPSHHIGSSLFNRCLVILT